MKQRVNQMKKIVGLMLITLVCSLAAMAQTTVWPGVDYTTLIDPNPTETGRTGQGIDDATRVLTPSANAKKFFLYHVKSGKFLYTGGPWDAKAVLKYYDFGLSYSLCQFSDNLYIVSPLVNMAGGSNASCLAYTDASSSGYTADEVKLSTGFYNDKGANKENHTTDARLTFERVEADPSATTYTYKIRTNSPKQYMTVSPNDLTETTYQTTDPGDWGEWRFVTIEEMNALFVTTHADAHGGLNVNLTYELSCVDFHRNENKSPWIKTYNGTETTTGRRDWRMNLNYTNEPWDAVVLVNEAGTPQETFVNPDGTIGGWYYASIGKQAIYNGLYYHGTMEGTGTIHQTYTVDVAGLYEFSLQGAYVGHETKFFAQVNNNPRKEMALYNVTDQFPESTFTSKAKVTTTNNQQWSNNYQYSNHRNKDYGLAIGKKLANGQYPITVYVRAKAGDVITFGFEKSGSTKSPASNSWSGKYYDTDFAAFDDIQLRYLGQDVYIFDEDWTEFMATPEAGYSNVTVLLQRNFLLNEWNSFVFPIALTKLQVKQAFGEGTELAYLDGLKDEAGTNCIHFTPEDLSGADGTVVKPGKFYIIKPTKAPNAEQAEVTIGDQTYVGPFYLLGRRDVNTADFATTATQQFPNDGNTSHEYPIKAMGTYFAGTCPAGGYVLSNGDMYHMRNEKAIKGFRGWIEDVISASGGNSKGLTFVVDNSKPADISGIHGLKEMLQKGNVYDLNGRLLNSSGSTEGLSKGIYLINGRKVLVK